jgi:hypothetical protein
MTALTQYFKSRASGRAVAGAVIFALLVVLVQQTLLVPHFQAVTGFKPLDVQFPLSRYTIAIQLGAYGQDAGAAYLPFLMVDLVLAAASAAALVLLWAWLFRQQRTRMFSFLERGAVILVPVYTLGCDFAENVAFARLIGGLSGESYAGTIEFAVMIHSVRGALLDVQVILTVLFVILFGFAAGKQERPGALRGETAINGE